MPQSEQELSPAPIYQQVVGDNGLLTNSWVLFFQKLLQRVGGGSTTPLDKTNAAAGGMQFGVDAAKKAAAAVSAQLGDLQQRQRDDAQLLTALQNEVAGLTVQSGAWTPTVTGATGSYTAAGYWESIGREVFVSIALTVTGSVTLSGASCDVSVPAVTPGTCGVANAGPYASYGVGVVNGSTLLLPNLTASGGVIVISGRYRR